MPVDLSVSMRSDFEHERRSSAKRRKRNKLNLKKGVFSKNTPFFGSPTEEGVLMEFISLIQSSLVNPIIMTFVLGVIAALLRSDLKLPDQIYQGLTLYLLFAIGLKGGAKISGFSPVEIIGPVIAGLLLSGLIALWSYFILRKALKLDVMNSAAICAHYGSVSALTFITAQTFLEVKSVHYEGFMIGLLSLMEIPGILVAIYLYRKNDPQAQKESTSGQSIWHEILTSKANLLLVGGMIIGAVCEKKGWEQVGPLFDAPFKGMLCLFLLQLGVMTGEHLKSVRQAGWGLALFALSLPFLNGFVGLMTGKLIGLSLGGTTLLGVLCASASYIAAPAAIQLVIPRANPSLYLCAALGITFPFNIVLGIPLYFEIATWLY
jgi:hypothetical protein